MAGGARVIRQLREPDAESYVELRRQGLLEAPLAFGASPEDDMAASAEAVRDRLRQGPGWVILGAFQDGLVGAVGLMRDRSVKAKVLVLAVLPPFEGRGIDKTLLSLAVEWLRSFKPTRIWLGASSDPGTRSHGFYRALGWRPVGKKDTHGDEILVLPSPGE